MTNQEIIDLINRHEEIRTLRLSLEKEEAQIENQLLVNLRDQVVGVGGSTAFAEVVKKRKLIATSWPMIYGFIRQHDAFDLLHRRLTDTAVTNRLNDGVHIPGIEITEVPTLVFTR